jgi:hypothetical protein
LAAKTGNEDLKGLLSADGRWDHVPSGTKLPVDEAPTLEGSPAAIVDGIKPVAGKPLTFTARDVIRPEKDRDLELIPFFRVHDSRYMLYWKTVKE